MQILYSYDDLNRTTEIKRYVDGINDEVLLDQVQYDVDNLLTQLDYGNGLQATFSYDARDRVSTMDVKNGTTSYLDLDYTYDSNSNITQLVNGRQDTSSTWHSETESYSYDGLDRLISASCTSWSHAYSYDKVGNRTSKDSVTYTINTVNEVTALSDGTSFAYDENGNRTQKTKGTDTWDYTYDYANRLIKVEENPTTIGEYVYDGDGKRIQVTEDSKTTTYIYSGYNAIYEENSTGIACHVYGPTGLLAKRTTISQQSDTYYYHTDHLGSVRQATDSSKNIVSAVTYLPFGETVTEQGSEHYLFTGKEQDTTGLYYYGARYYDPDVARFIARDPFRGKQTNPQSLNRYTYCLNNPLKIVDPWGEKNFYIEGGGEQEEPEITGDPSYDGYGQITVPTSMGDVTIDLDTNEDWGDVDDKLIQNQVREEFENLERGREKYKEYQAKKNRNIRKKYSMIGVGICLEAHAELVVAGEALLGAAVLTAGLAVTHKGSVWAGCSLGGLLTIAFLGGSKSLTLLFLVGLATGGLLLLAGAALIAVGVYLIHDAYERQQKNMG
jgi:RHS repeat-associated protein